MSSFFCERTAEYALVPILQRALKDHFGAAIPIFFWKTREGNRTSSEIHKSQYFQVLAMFARRPKVTNRSGLISGKINFELFQFAEAASALGIPTIAGFPAVATLNSLYRDPPIFWFDVNKSEIGQLDFFTDTTTSTPLPIYVEGDPIRCLHIEEIFKMVTEKAGTYSWSEAMEHISTLRSERFRGDGFFGFGWFGGYKPVYFLISRDD